MERAALEREPHKLDQKKESDGACHSYAVGRYRSMPFPIVPPLGGSEPFLIQDPFALRKQILPVLTVDKDDGYLTGLGSAFLVDPFGSFVTAEHVLKEHFESPTRRTAAVATVLHSMGLVYGTVGMSSKYFAPITSFRTFQSASPEPPPLVGVKAPNKIVADAMLFVADHREVPNLKPPLPLPLRLSGIRPQIGDKVMAVGYPEITCLQHEPPKSAISYAEGMYGAVGTVTNLLPFGQGKTYPWPLIEVAAHWASGMSGGPVFNEAGEVIGLVSFSFEPYEGAPGIGYATDLATIQIQRLVPTVSSTTPGSYACWGVVRMAPWHLAGVFAAKEEADAHRDMLGTDYEVRFGTHAFGTDDFMCVNIA